LLALAGLDQGIAGRASRASAFRSFRQSCLISSQMASGAAMILTFFGLRYFAFRL
jgi:hypothetical protein